MEIPNGRVKASCKLCSWSDEMVVRDDDDRSVFATRIRLHSKIGHSDHAKVSFRVNVVPIEPARGQFIRTPDGQKLFLAGKIWMRYELVGGSDPQAAITDNDVRILNDIWCKTEYCPWLDHANYHPLADFKSDEYLR
jgi:hypothetical protein